MSLSNYSVLMSVYYKDNSVWLEEAICSILKQTFKTNEFIIVKDGKLTPELDDVINKFYLSYPNLFKIVTIEKNVGLGRALAIGVENCTNQYIARMDSDDISIENRCELEISKLISENLDIVGSLTYEFIDSVNNVASIRKLPEYNEEIYVYAKKRNPFCHSSLMIKKKAIIEAGNFREFHLCEDYDMWVRMFKNNVKCYNFQIPLTYMRISDDFYKRRGGIKYLVSILKFKHFCFSIGFYSIFDYLVSSCATICVCILPNVCREFVYKNLLRGGSND